MGKISAIAQELDELENLMARHDRWYQYSEDFRVFQKGRNEWQVISSAMARLSAIGWSKEVQALSDQYFPKEPTSGV